MSNGLQNEEKCFDGHYILVASLSPTNASSAPLVNANFCSNTACAGCYASADIII